jgi:hypothetical protein
LALTLRAAPISFALALGLALSLGPASPALAVVITTGDGTGNTTAPPDDPGFANVGTISSTGIYLRNGWVLTAAHAGAGNIALGGVSYVMVPGSEVQLLTKSEVPPVASDLVMYRIQDPPPLPPLKIASLPPILGEAAVLIGNGDNREATETYWDVDWQEVTPMPAAFAGWKKGSGRTVRWGTNTVTTLALQTPFNQTLTDEFRMDFDNLSDEGQAIAGDSGGAVFIKRGETWELAGMMNFVQRFENQPAGSAVLGNRSLAADLSVYHDQIQALVTQVIPASSPNSMASLIGLLAVFGVLATRALRGRA